MMKRQLRLWAYAMLIAAAVLFFCSKSSFGYPINDWADANIYLTIGKGMTQGQVVYRDLYDHKGPLLYALHALCALVSFDSFLGVYVMEVLLAAAFLYCTHGLMEAYGFRRAAWALLPVVALAAYTSVGFSLGDSAEEMCLPLAAGTLWGVCAYLKSGERDMRRGSLLLHGVLTGCVFWIKFTMIGLHMGLLGWVLLRHLLRREWKSFGRAVGWLAAGFALSTAPWIVYFGLNGAIGDWLKVYLYDNLFLYSSSGEALSLAGRAKAMVKCGLDWVVNNPGCSVPIAAGLLWFAVKRRREAAAVWLMAALGAFFTFIGGKSYPYYGLMLASLLPLAGVMLGGACERMLEKPGRFVPVCAVSCVLAVGLCPVLSPNPFPSEGYALLQPREETMQYRFAEIIVQDEAATLLNYGFMDAGFYTAAQKVPQVKYFHQTNVPLEEMLDEQIRYIDEGLCTYVVTRGRQPDGMEERYELIATEPSPNFWYENVYLYRLKTDKNR